jgi:hypothetical protein
MIASLAQDELRPRDLARGHFGGTGLGIGRPSGAAWSQLVQTLGWRCLAGTTNGIPRTLSSGAEICWIMRAAEQAADPAGEMAVIHV